MKRLVLASLVLAAMALTGCAVHIPHEEMTPIALDVAHPHPQSVTVTTLPKPGADPSSASTVAAMTELRTALDESIRGYKVFAGVKPEGGDYRLTVQVREVATPAFAIAFTSTVTLDWSLARANGAVVWHETIATDYTVGGDEAFVGTERQRRSIAGAVRKNIGAGLQRIGALAL
nr:hypothetical protein [uncultured Massilia sp.]